MSISLNAANDFIIRTEDLLPDKTLELYVPTERDEQLVTMLRSHTPIIIEGSRGTGKSLLLRVCEQQQIAEFQKDNILPVYVSFTKSSLLDSSSPMQFTHWMLSRLAAAIVRAIQKRGISLGSSRALNILTGGTTSEAAATGKTRLEVVAEEFERSYRKPKSDVDDEAVPTIETFKEAIEDICDDLGISRFNVLFDEAAHIFRPEQQRQFFTLFRDLRSPRMTCNAAVYPGVTAYGQVFEGTHDARIEQLARDINSAEYATQMREIVLRQANSELSAAITQRGELFDALAYAVAGNPRLLLKIIARTGKFTSGTINGVIKDFFRVDIWSEHSGLSGRYPGHKALIDWGRKFVEQAAIPEAKKKNDGWRERATSERSVVIWVSREAPEAAMEGLRLLTYTGILNRMDDGIKGTNSRIGTRYSINVGCLVAGETAPIEVIKELRSFNTTKRFTEFGASNHWFQQISEDIGTFVESDISVALSELIKRPVNDLDLTPFQKQALQTIGIVTIEQALDSTEQDLQGVRYIGPKRSRHIKNVVTAAALEYLSG